MMTDQKLKFGIQVTKKTIGRVSFIHVLGLKLLLLIGVITAPAQITMTVTTDLDRYICYEPINVTISLKNNSGHTLNFGTDSVDSGFIKFELRSLKNIPIQSLDRTFNPAADLSLSPGVVKALTLPLTNYFDVQTEDDYELVIRISHPRLHQDYLSKPRLFQVRHGVRIRENMVGNPTSPVDKIIPVLKCSLNIFNHSSGDIYYLQLEDNDYVYAIARLGPRMQGVTPQLDIDALSRIHTLVQIAPRIFQHRIFDHSGQLKLTSAYTISDTTPTLIRDPDVGRVIVSGGLPAAAGEDFSQISITKDDIPQITTEMIDKQPVPGTSTSKKSKKKTK
jgi:hypothetical protein